jgi:hypothetical protein
VLLLLLLLLLLLQDVVYCPRCETVCIEDKDHCAQCAKCLYVFCSFCQDSWHPGSECLDPHEVRQHVVFHKMSNGSAIAHPKTVLCCSVMCVWHPGSECLDLHEVRQHVCASFAASLALVLQYNVAACSLMFVC